MKQAYVVTEDKAKVEILKKLLPELVKTESQFITGPSYSIDSISSTILMDKRVPVAVVVDANTDDELIIYEHRDFLEYALNRVPNVPFKILFAVPAIEMIFFQDKPMLEQLVNHKFTDLEWEFAKYHPKKSLAYFLGENPLSILVNKLNDKSIVVLQQHPFIIELVEFLSSVIDTKQESGHTIMNCEL